MARAGSRGNAYRNGGGGTCECGGDRPARRGIRADTTARSRRGAVRSWRHADVQGRDLRRARGDPPRRSLPARAPARARGHPRPGRPGRAGRRGDGRERAHQARRDHPGGRRPVPAHAHRLRAHRGERWLLRPHRARAGDPASAGGGGTRIAQLGYSGDGGADEIVDRAEAEVYSVAARRISEDYLALAEIMPGALDEIEAIGSRGGGLTGGPPGFAALAAPANGLHPGQMIVIAARPALGKALALDTPLPTPTGWTTMGQV